MFKRVCRHCHKASYSLSKEGKWLCPGCGADLADHPILARSSSTAQILPVTSALWEGPNLN